MNDCPPRRRDLPKYPIAVGKARQKLTQAILTGDHELASWIDLAVRNRQVTGAPKAIAELRQRLDEVMAPIQDQITPHRG